MAGPEKKTEANVVKKVEYIPFREVKVEDIKKLPTVLVKLELRRSVQYGDSVQLTIEFDPRFKKVIKKTAIIDLRKYSLIVASRSDFKEDEDIHLAALPVRYFQRHDAEGEVKYQRFEVMFTRKVVISDFFDYVDEDLMEILNMDFKFLEDRDSTKEFTLANAEIDYVHFQ